jgi:ElaB/YqjD/DUF883 family membrane-anchored ribosome-binding protein
MEVTMENYGQRSDGQDFDAAKDGLVNGFKALIADAETLVKATANYSSEGVAAARSKFEDGLYEAKSRLTNAQSAVAGKTGEAVELTESYVQNHPWKALAAAVAVGAIVALVIAKRSN